MYQDALFILDTSDNDLCNYGWKIASENPNTAVRFVRGNKMRGANGVFDEISAACQFPYYFGHNWPTLAECLGDLNWIGSLHFVLITTRFTELLADEPLEMVAFGRALGAAIEGYNRERKITERHNSNFRVIVSCKYIDQNVGETLFKEVGSPAILHI
jgi:Barstar (barnase inhibitor)